MSNKRLTAWIDGQEVLPVRAITYVTGGRFSPDILARRFTGDDPLDKNWNLRAYESLGGTWLVVNSPMWKEIAVSIQRFETQVKEQFPTHISGYVVWRVGTVALLPAGVFVRMDEFQKTLQDYLDGVIFCSDRTTKDKLTLSPVMDVNIRAMVMEDFEEITEGDPAKSDVIVVASSMQRSFLYEINNVDSNENEVSCPVPQLSHDDSPIIEDKLDAAISVDPDVPESSLSKPPVNTAETALPNREKNDYPEQIAALFDPVRVKALEKMFPAEGKWKTWAEKSRANGLSEARTSHGYYNPYIAAIWFVNRVGWDLAHCYRVLANNLPARSRDEKHLLTDYQ